MKPVCAQAIGYGNDVIGEIVQGQVFQFPATAHNAALVDHYQPIAGLGEQRCDTLIPRVVTTGARQGEGDGSSTSKSFSTGCCRQRSPALGGLLNSGGNQDGLDDQLLEQIRQKTFAYYPEEHHNNPSVAARALDLWKQVDEVRQLAVNSRILL